MSDYTKLCGDLRDKPRYKDKATLGVMDLCFLAADAIERLEAENERLRKKLDAAVDDLYAANSHCNVCIHDYTRNHDCPVTHEFKGVCEFKWREED